MLKQNDVLRCFFTIVVTNKRYECMVPMHCTMQKALCLLRELIHSEQKGMYTIDSCSLVYEEFSNLPCAMDVPFAKLNVYDGISFLVY